MLGGMLAFLASLSTAHVVSVGVVAAIVVEVATLVMRFGFAMKSPTVTHRAARFTRGWRVHHGFVGLAVLLLATALPLPPPWGNLAWISGIALFLSDAIHHFAVLHPVFGDSEFDLRYPEHGSDVRGPL